MTFANIGHAQVQQISQQRFLDIQRKNDYVVQIHNGIRVADTQPPFGSEWHNEAGASSILVGLLATDDQVGSHPSHGSPARAVMATSPSS